MTKFTRFNGLTIAEVSTLIRSKLTNSELQEFNTEISTKKNMDEYMDFMLETLSHIQEEII
jgi:hypothetical protein